MTADFTELAMQTYAKDNNYSHRMTTPELLQADTGVVAKTVRACLQFIENAQRHPKAELTERFDRHLTPVGVSQSGAIKAVGDGEIASYSYNPMAFDVSGLTGGEFPQTYLAATAAQLILKKYAEKLGKLSGDSGIKGNASGYCEEMDDVYDVTFSLKGRGLEKALLQHGAQALAEVKQELGLNAISKRPGANEAPSPSHSQRVIAARLPTGMVIQ